MFARLSLKTRLLVLVVVSLAGMVALAVLQVTHLRGQLLEDRKVTLKSAIEIAASTVAGFQAKVAKGELPKEQAQTLARESLRSMRYQGNEYFYIYDSKAMGVMHPIRPEYEGKSHWDRQDKSGAYTVRDLVNAALDKSGYVRTLTVKPGGTEQLPKLHFLTHYEPWDWVIGTGLYVDDIDAVFRAQLASALVAIAVLMAIVAATALAVIRAVLRDIGGEPAMAVSVMREVAGGNLTVGLRDVHAGSLLGELDRLVQSLRSVMAQITAGAGRVSKAAHDINATTGAVAAATEVQTDNTQSMAASMEQLTVSINHISDNAGETARHASAAAELARNGQKQVSAAADDLGNMSQALGGAADQVRTLAENAQEVSGILTSIQGIAEQTNLLALNAAIEAARAGEQGRGFAVVADEVRVLSRRTQASTTEIQSTIDTLQRTTQQAVTLMEKSQNLARLSVLDAEEASRALNEITRAVSLISDMSTQIATAAEEQTKVTEEITTNVTAIKEVGDELADGAREEQQESRRLQEQAADLNEKVARFVL